MSLKSIAKNEPVLLGSQVLAVLGYFAQFAVQHGWVGATEASTAVQTVAPGVTAAVIAIFGLVIRNFVSPVEQKVENSPIVHDVEKVVAKVEKALSPAPAVPPVTVAPVTPAPSVEDSDPGVVTNDIPVITN